MIKVEAIVSSSFYDIQKALIEIGTPTFSAYQGIVYIYHVGKLIKIRDGKLGTSGL